MSLVDLWQEVEKLKSRIETMHDDISEIYYMLNELKEKIEG